MKTLKFILITFVLASGSQLAEAQGYKLNGTASGIPDSTKLYLRVGNPAVEIDSAMVMGGKFTMTGRIKERGLQVYLHTKGYTNYTAFWMENAVITLNLKAGEFKKGTITGSATEDEENALKLSKAAITKKLDSLDKAYGATKDAALQAKINKQFRAAQEEEIRINVAYVDAHPGSIVAANMLNVYSSTWGRETATRLYNNLSAENKASQFGKEINNFISLNKNLKVGDKYADFEQMNANGQKLKLSDVKGKYVLVDFWASWCGPCRADNPALLATYNQFKSKGLAILGVSLDVDKGEWLGAIAHDKLPWENVADMRGDRNTAALIYGISAVPSNFLIDGNGIIVAKNLRGKELAGKLKKLLK